MIDDNKIAGYVHYYKYSGGGWEWLHTLYVTIEKKRVGLLRRKAIDIKIYTYDPWDNEIIPADTDDGSFLYVRVYKNGRTKLMHRTAQVPYLTQRPEGFALKISVHLPNGKDKDSEYVTSYDVYSQYRDVCTH